MCRRVFAWYLWISARLDDAAQPDSANLHVQIGFNTVLCIRSLFVSESGKRLPMSHNSSLI